MASLELFQASVAMSLSYGNFFSINLNLMMQTMCVLTSTATVQGYYIFSEDFEGRSKRHCTKNVQCDASTGRQRCRKHRDCGHRRTCCRDKGTRQKCCVVKRYRHKYRVSAGVFERLTSSTKNSTSQGQATPKIRILSTTSPERKTTRYPSRTNAPQTFFPQEQSTEVTALKESTFATFSKIIPQTNTTVETATGISTLPQEELQTEASVTTAFLPESTPVNVPSATINIKSSTRATSEEFQPESTTLSETTEYITATGTGFSFTNKEPITTSSETTRISEIASIALQTSTPITSSSTAFSTFPELLTSTETIIANFSTTEPQTTSFETRSLTSSTTTEVTLAPNNSTLSTTSTPTTTLEAETSTRTTTTTRAMESTRLPESTMTSTASQGITEFVAPELSVLLQITTPETLPSERISPLFTAFETTSATTTSITSYSTESTAQQSSTLQFQTSTEARASYVNTTTQITSISTAEFAENSTSQQIERITTELAESTAISEAPTSALPPSFPTTTNELTTQSIPIQTSNSSLTEFSNFLAQTTGSSMNEIIVISSENSTETTTTETIISKVSSIPVSTAISTTESVEVIFSTEASLSESSTVTTEATASSTESLATQTSSSGFEYVTVTGFTTEYALPTSEISKLSSEITTISAEYSNMSETEGISTSTMAISAESPTSSTFGREVSTTENIFGTSPKGFTEAGTSAEVTFAPSETLPTEAGTQPSTTLTFPELTENANSLTTTSKFSATTAAPSSTTIPPEQLTTTAARPVQADVQIHISISIDIDRAKKMAETEDL